MNDQTQFVCPSCGYDTDELTEGYCSDCQSERQHQLDEHNARLDWWDGLTDAQRDNQIRWEAT